MTEPDPSGIGEDRYGTSRKIIRISLIVGLGNTLLSGVNENLTLSPEVHRVLLVLGALAGLVALVGQFAQLNYLSKLATRIPDYALERRARFLMWAIGVSYGILLVVGLAMALMARSAQGQQPGGALAGLGCAMGIFAIAVLVFGIMYLLMLDKFRRHFGEEALRAEQSWASAQAGAAGGATLF